MYVLKKDNVTRLTDNEKQKDDYISKGYIVIEQAEQESTESEQTESKKAKKATNSGGEADGQEK